MLQESELYCDSFVVRAQVDSITCFGISAMSEKCPVGEPVVKLFPAAVLRVSYLEVLLLAKERVRDDELFCHCPMS